MFVICKYNYKTRTYRIMTLNIYKDINDAMDEKKTIEKYDKNNEKLVVLRIDAFPV